MLKDEHDCSYNCGGVARPLRSWSDFSSVHQCVNQVVCVLFSRVFDSEGVQYQCETDRLSLVSPQRWRTLARKVVELQKVGFDPTMLGFLGFLKPWSYFSGFRVQPTIECNFSQVLIIYDLFLYVFEQQVCVFTPSHWCCVIEIFYVKGGIFRLVH